MIVDPAPRPRANQPRALRSKIEEAALTCQQIGNTLALLSRQEDLDSDFVSALAALERLCLYTADDIDDLVRHLPAP